MISCREASRLASESLDRRLRPAEQVELRLHLLMCRLCRAAFEQLKILREVGRRFFSRGPFEEDLPDVHLEEEEKERIKAVLRANASSCS